MPFQQCLYYNTLSLLTTIYIECPPQDVSAVIEMTTTGTPD